MRRPASRWLPFAALMAAGWILLALACGPTGPRPREKRIVDTVCHGGFTVEVEHARRDDWRAVWRGEDQIDIASGDHDVHIADGFLLVGDVDHGDVKPGDTIKLLLDGTVLVNGVPRHSYPVQPRELHPPSRGLWDMANLDASSVAWSPNGRLLAAGSRSEGRGPPAGGHASVWDTRSWQAAFTLDRTEPADAVAFSPNGKMVATAAAPGILRLFDTNEGEQLHELALGEEKDCRLAFLSDDWLIVKQDTTLIAQPIGNPAGVAVELGKAHDRRGGQPFDLSRDRSTIVAADREQVRVIRPKVTPDACLPEVVATIDGRAHAAAVSADGKLLALFDDLSTSLQIREAASGQILRRLRVRGNVRTHPVNAMAFSPDGRWLVLGDAAGTVRLYDAAMGREVSRFATVSGGGVNQLAFSPNGTALAGALGQDPGPKVEVWQLADLLPR